MAARGLNNTNIWIIIELDCLKAQAIVSNRLWQEAGRPRSGPIYNKRNSDKREYRGAIRRAEADTKNKYSNELHEQLLTKDGGNFWRCWNAKFEKKTNLPTKVNGHLDPDSIVACFVKHFKSTCTDDRNEASHDLYTVYKNRRLDYIGAPLDNAHSFDAELVEKVVVNMHRGKAAGLDGLTLYCTDIFIGEILELFCIRQVI